MPEAEDRDTRRSAGRRWRPWLRGLHRDVGYALVGLTVVYALSGLAVNHIADWDPNFVSYERSLPLTATMPEDPLDEQAAARAVLDQLGVSEVPAEVFGTDLDLQIMLDGRELFVDYEARTILDRGQRARPVVRAANWLHLNRGKRAWTIVADAYAVLLLFLAGSGMFMLPGKRGLRGRGWILVSLGAAVPILYVVLSGGP